MRQEHKDRINEMINTNLFGGENAAAFTQSLPVLSKVIEKFVKDKGFRIQVFDNTGGEVFWTDPTATKVIFSRAYEITVTRSADHQRLVEKRGDVKKGDNTYVSKVGETYTAELHKSRFIDPELDLPYMARPVFDEMFPLIASLILKSWGRPDVSDIKDFKRKL